MKTQIIKTAIRLGFDYENFIFETKQELEDGVMNFLLENSGKLPKIKEFCEVTGNGSSQHVCFDEFESSGEIINWSQYYGKRKQRIYHSYYLHIDKVGNCFEMKLYCFNK